MTDLSSNITFSQSQSHGTVSLNKRNKYIYVRTHTFINKYKYININKSIFICNNTSTVIDLAIDVNTALTADDVNVTNVINENDYDAAASNNFSEMVK